MWSYIIGGEHNYKFAPYMISSISLSHINSIAFSDDFLTKFKEGILDSIMNILGISFQLFEKENIPATTDPSFLHAKLAANCCVALGKAHFSGSHAEGETSDMPNYTFEAVPISKQVAQMLFQLPHHRALNEPGGARRVSDSS